MAAISIKTLNRIGTWLAAICAITYTAISIADIGIHVYEGWMKGVKERDRIVEAQAECVQQRFKAIYNQEHCAIIRSRSVPSPWAIAMHEVGHYLRDQIVWVLQSAAMLAFAIVPIAIVTFCCFYRFQNSAMFHNTTAHHHPESFVVFTSNMLRSLISGSDKAHEASDISRRPPASFVMDMGTTTRSANHHHGKIK